MSFYPEEELRAVGFRSLGRNVKVSRLASIYGASRIDIGDHTRIDDFCVLSAGEHGIHIGRNVHVAVFCSLIGAERIELQDFCGISSRVSIYSSNDDYSGAFLTGPTIPADYTNVTSAPVIVGRHVIIGAGTVVLPGVTLEDGVAVGSLSLVRKDCEAFGIYFGSPAKRMGSRRQDLIGLEQRYLATEEV